ncbi:acryloyl-CoA reductase [Aureimonas sp. AU4]|uniref:acrylyl-CoA reductase family protein n=1 Tax=Aureimonas sp. AU4 TaxID=1638163 RepID=UPI00078366D7|nr:acryloyl-CoA reductase [Aureimonas sp. AU4]
MAFRALLTEKPADGAVRSSVQTLDEDRLPAGDVTVAVEWSGLNYKDGLCVLDKGRLVRAFPHVGGIDFAGIVTDSADPRYHVGDRVVLTGWRVGETHWGGFAERARVRADWLVPLPEGLSTRQAMIFGTAGLAAAMAVERLEALGVQPDSGEIAVTGASGGVGSLALLLLAAAGFRAVAVTGRTDGADDLLRLGASRVAGRDEITGEPPKPLEAARWAGAIDNVGGETLGRLLRQLSPGGAVAAVGNASGIGFEGSVLPFLLRGVTLAGIDSVTHPYERRVASWQRIASAFDAGRLEPLVSEIGLDVVPEAAARILRGETRGRVLVRP